MKTVTAVAPSNIAVIKYWGKKDEELILPLNGSISATLDSNFMHAKTTVAVDASFEKDRLWLNGKEETVLNKRFQTVLNEVRKRADKTKSEVDVSWKIHICSVNNFPTAAGLASSAAGFACLVYSLCKLFSIEGECSDIARQGSGSACRSMYGGWVEWVKGSKKDGRDSIASQLVPAQHWPELRVLIVVTNHQQKHISSTMAQKLSVQTSDLLTHRISTIAPRNLDLMKQHIVEKNFQKFAKLTMQDSNNMHACMLDTHPPIIYLSSQSHHIIQLVHLVNDFYGRIVVGYSFDAGSNACLFVLKKDSDHILCLLRYFYQPMGGELLIKGLPTDIETSSVDYKLLKVLESKLKPLLGSVSYVINTKVGEGPTLLPPSQTLINIETGLPL